MRLKHSLVLLSLLFICTPLLAKKNNFSQRILNARSVAIVFLSVQGEAVDPASPDISLQDRNMLAAVEGAFRNWNRFSVTTNARAADLIVAVRTGQQKLRGGIIPGIPRPDTSGRGAGPVFGGDSGANLDIFQVCDVNTAQRGHEVMGAVLWKGSRRGGLDTPDLPLLYQFKKELDEAEKAASQNGSSKKP